MSTPEAAQQALYNRADEVFGKPYSDTLMSALLVNTADLATKSDLKNLEERFDQLEERFDRLELAVERSMERFFGLYKTIIWAMVALTGIFSAVVGLLR